MRAVQLTLVYVAPFLFVSAVGCSGLLQRPVSDGEASYSLGDTPAQRSTPRQPDSPTGTRTSLESLIVGDSATGLVPPERNSIDGHQITVDQIELRPDSVQMEVSSDPDRMAEEIKSQLPDLLENAKHPYSKPVDLSNTQAVQNPVDQEIRDSKKQPGITLSLSDQTPDSVMRFTAEPAPDPRRTLPEDLDAMFSDAKSAGGVITDDQVEPVTHLQASNQENAKVPGQGASQPKSGELVMGGVTPRIIIQEEEEAFSVGTESATEAATGNQPQPVTWEHHLEQTIRSLTTILESGAPDAQEKAALQLKLLKIVADEFDPKLETAARPDSSENEFWSNQLSAVDTLLNQPRLSDRAAEEGRRARTAGETRQLLEKAIDELAALAPLKISKYTFCTKITGFGQFTPAANRFTPGEQVLIYCELDNYGLREETLDGHTTYHAEMRGEYTIWNSDNRVVYQYQYQPVHDEAQSRRHDFYMYFPITLPKNLTPDTYRLQMSIEDMVGQKGASTGPPLNFRIEQPGARTANEPTPRQR